MNFAVDRKRFAETIIKNLGGQVTDLPWSPGSPAYDATKNDVYAFDLDKARSLLTAAGVSNVTLEMIYSSISNEFGSFAQIYQSDLATVGVNLNVRGARSCHIEPAHADAQFQHRRYQQQLLATRARLNVPTQWRLSPHRQHRGFQSDQYVALADASQSEADPAKRQQIYSQINDLLLDESFNISIGFQPTYMVATRNVNGVRWRVNQAPVFADVWLA